MAGPPNVWQSRQSIAFRCWLRPRLPIHVVGRTRQWRSPGSVPKVVHVCGPHAASAWDQGEGLAHTHHASAEDRRETAHGVVAGKPRKQCRCYGLNCVALLVVFCKLNRARVLFAPVPCLCFVPCFGTIIRSFDLQSSKTSPAMDTASNAMSKERCHSSSRNTVLYSTVLL